MKKKILIVDDNKTIRDGLKIFLEEVGYEAIVIDDGLHGYLHTYIYSPDLVIMDIFMPFASGIETAQDIQETKIPIIFITGNPDKNLKDKSKEFNTIGFFEKPLDLDKLLETINNYFKVEKKI